MSAGYCIQTCDIDQHDITCVLPYINDDDGDEGRMGAGQHGIFHAAEDLGHDITENELPDITKDDTADQVGQEVGRSEESHSLQLGGAQKRQQEGDKIDQDHVEHDEKRREQDGPQEAGLFEHSRVVRKSHKLSVTDSVPVRKGVEQSQEQGNDDRHNKRK